MTTALYAPGSFQHDVTEEGYRALLLTVYGDPRGQGRISGGGKGRLAYYSNAKVLLPWREAVQHVAMAATGGHAIVKPQRVKRPPGAPKVRRPKSAGPVRCLECRVPVAEHGWLATAHNYAVGMEIIATFEPLKTDPDRPHVTSSKHGDWDHHGRAEGDALSGVVYPDDRMITEAHVYKTYPGRRQYALDRPGVLIRVWEIPA